MASFRLLNYAGVAGEARPGILVGDEVIDLQSAGLAGSTYELLQDWEANQEKMAKIADDAASHDSRPLSICWLRSCIRRSCSTRRRITSTIRRRWPPTAKRW